MKLPAVGPLYATIKGKTATEFTKHFHCYALLTLLVFILTRFFFKETLCAEDFFSCVLAIFQEINFGREPEFFSVDCSCLTISMFLNKIIEEKKRELKSSKSTSSLNDLRKKAADAEGGREFKKSLQTKDSINIIAEIKKASPSKGIIRENFNPVEIAEIYGDNGAAAISVLTDKTFFQGDIKYLNEIRKKISLPLLRKDFIIDEYQLYEAKAYGADAALLIAAVLDRNQLSEYLDLSREIGLENLVEVHSFKDMEKAMQCDVEIIGINNRDLHTFETSLKTSFDLAREIPKDRVIVSESGINTYEDILKLKKSGINAFLIGEALMKERDIAKKLKKLIG